VGLVAYPSLLNGIGAEDATSATTRATTPNPTATPSSHAEHILLPTALTFEEGVVGALAFTQYCHYQYCMVYSIQKEGRGEVRSLHGSRAILLHQCGAYRSEEQ